MRQMLFRQIGLNLPPRYRQKGSHHKTVAGTHRGESGNTRSPHQIEEQRLHTVVAMMSYGNSLRPILAALLFKPIVAQPTACHLNRQAVFPGVAQGVERNFVEGYAPFPHGIAREIAVAQRLLSPQIKIAMAGNTRISQPIQHVQQCHRISSTAHSHNDGSRLVQQSVIGNKSLNPVQKLRY